MLDPDHRLVVVGASLAGLRTIEAARRRGYAGRITLIGAEPHLPYDRPPLSKAFLDEKQAAELAPFRTADHLQDELGVELVLGAPATGLDPSPGVVEVGGTRQVGYDALVIATGADARSLPGTEGIGGVHCLRTLDDARAVRTALDEGARTVVVGAGFIGSEVASGARKRGLPVTVVEAQPVPLTRSVGVAAGEVCARLHRENGTDLRCGVGVERLEADGGRVRRVVLSDGSVLEADLVVVGVGVRPNTGWLAGSGVELHADGGIVCDEVLRTSVPNVVAAGDVVHWPNPLFENRVMRLEHWTNAAEHGAAAAVAALDPQAATPVATVPYFWSDWYDHRIQFVGIPTEPDEVRVIADEPYLALYRQGDRVVGALTIDRPTQIMKYRRLIGARASWSEALEFAGARG